MIAHNSSINVRKVYYGALIKISLICKTLQNIELAKYDTENILKPRQNDKLEISLEHIKYIQSIIYGRICYLERYSNSDTIRIAIQYYLEALTSDNNKLELDDIRKKKTYKFIYADLQSLIKYVKNNSQVYPDIISDCGTLELLIK